ncbi:hypothetical protein CFC21_035282 [Triticum aestivum]|uniref:Uncharacterized protein n=3 Tax=Triticum TaxID=4564 RepID=A0A9R0RIA2_TRITD|nr:hypothetical protein CFC21_035282 [Triticum aestivum]VAH61052.1 unnamed protein product [Triticum turgidum subsp. durum]
MEIWVADPKATPRVMSSLFFRAKITAPACSAALPTMGSRMMLMKLTERPHDCEVGSMVPTTYSESTAIMMVMRMSQKSALPKPRTASSSSSSPPSISCGSKSWRCVLSWKKR